MTIRKTYTAEFKRQALELAAREYVGPSRAARDLGINLSALCRWRKQAEKQGPLAFPGQGRPAMTPQGQEIKRLRKELEILRQEREILVSSWRVKNRVCPVQTPTGGRSQKWLAGEVEGIRALSPQARNCTR